MTVKVLYIDDEIEERDPQKIQKRLNASSRLACELRLPPRPNRFPELISELPDALLVDLDLSTAIVEGENITYFGSTLASEVRQRRPNCPIILITKPNIIATNPEQLQLLEESIDVDLIVNKDDVHQNPNAVINSIVSLTNGFKQLDNILGKEWDSVIQLMKADNVESDLLREAAPPIEKHRWTIPQTSRWIRNVIMGYPGILYNDLVTATRLGIDLPSFHLSEVQETMRPAEYTGIFGSFGQRWWRNRAIRIAQDLVYEHGLTGPISSNFVKAFEIECGIQPSPAVCVYDETPIADWVCYILNKPVKLKNSVPYYPDSRPSVMEPARVSFKAIEESESFDESLVDADSMEIVTELWGIS